MTDEATFVDWFDGYLTELDSGSDFSADPDRITAISGAKRRASGGSEAAREA